MKENHIQNQLLTINKFCEIASYRHILTHEHQNYVDNSTFQLFY